MTPRSNFDDRLDDWLEDGPTNAPGQLLDSVLAAVPSILQRRGAWRIPWRTAPMLGFARVLAAIVIAVGLGSAALFVVLRPVPGGIGSPASPSPAVVASPTTTASTTASPETTGSPTPTAEPCGPAQLEALITLWEGAAGHRIAHVDLSNKSSSPCITRSMARPQLVGGDGSVLIDGAAPAGSNALTIKPGATLKTLVQDGNYCGPAPTAPVSVAFVLGGGARIVATPFSPTDLTLPPCLGAPGSAGSIEMHPWAP